MKKDIKSVEELMKILNETNLTDISFEKEGFKIKIKKSNTPVQKPVNVQTSATPIIKYEEIVSNKIGNFIFATPAISVGDTLKKGQEVGYISTIGVKSSVVSEVEGIVREILVENGSVADFGKSLIKVEV